MKTLIEIYDKDEAIHNVLITLIFKPKNVIFLVESALTEKEEQNVRHFLEIHGAQPDITFVHFPNWGVQQMVRTLEEITWQYEDITFEITGGNSYLVSVISQYAFTRDISLLYKVWKRKNLIVLNHLQDETIEITLPHFKIGDILNLYGAGIDHLDHFRSLFNDEQRLQRYTHLSHIYFMHLDAWDSLIDWFQKSEYIEEWGDDGVPNGTLRIEGNALSGKKAKRLIPVFKDLDDGDILKILQIDEFKTVVKLRDKDIAIAFKIQGAWLELWTYLVLKRMDLFDDLHMSVIINWDKGKHHNNNRITNEIDVIGIRGLTSVFISCKMSLSGRSVYDMYEIKILCEKFGGMRAKAVMVTLEKEKKINPVFLHKAEELGVTVIPFEDVFSEGMAGIMRDLVGAS